MNDKARKERGSWFYELMIRRYDHECGEVKTRKVNEKEIKKYKIKGHK